MDSSAWALLFPLSILLLVAAVYYLFFSSSSNKQNQLLGRQPPSPPSVVPLLGNLVWLYKSLLDLSPTLRRLRVELGAPLVTFKFGLFPAIFVIDRALIHEALVQKGAVFGDRPPVRGATAIFSSKGHNISSGRGAVWRALRRNLVSEMFHTSRLRAFAGVRKRVLRHLLAELKQEAAGDSGGVVVFAKSFRRAIFRLLVLMCFGEKVDDKTIVEIERVQLDLISIGLKLGVFDVLPTAGKILFWGTWRKFLAIRRRQEEIMIPLITALRNARMRPYSGLVSYADTLIDFDLQEEGGGRRKLSDDEIVSLCSEFFNAGTDTTAVTAEWAMANLVKYPHIQARLAEEIAAGETLTSPRNDMNESETLVTDDEAVLQKTPYLKAVILETLRRHPPAQFLLPHATAEDTTLGGGEWALPKGAYVNFAVAEAGWDGSVWEEPWEFRPERFLESGEAAGVDVTGNREIKMIPFGAGRRICPGMGLAMLHLGYFVSALIREFEWRPPAEGEGIDLSEKMTFAVQMKNPLRSRIITRLRAASTADRAIIQSNSFTPT